MPELPLVQLAFDPSIGFPAPFPPVGQCTCCNVTVATGHGATNDLSALYCADCYSEKYSTCEDCAGELDNSAGEARYFDEHRRNDSAGPYCDGCFHGRFTRCPYCGEYAYNDDIITTGGAECCADCYSEYFTVCDGCGDCINIDDCHRGAGGDPYCESCYTNQHRNGEEGNFPAKSFLPRRNSTHRTGSARKFGVELETSSCDQYMDLAGHVHFGAKDDGSISGKEFVSTILHGDAGLAAIEDFCARANDMGFKTNSSCGYHVHCDVSDLAPDQLRAVATAYFLSREVWTSFVSSARRNNHYCGPTPWNLDNIGIRCHSDFRYWSESQDRYAWFNIASYARYGTFEIRLHSASLDPAKVINWVVAHTRFIDAVAKMSVSQVMARFQFATKESKFEIIARLWGSPALADFYSDRADHFGSPVRAPVRLNLANAS